MMTSTITPRKIYYLSAFTDDEALIEAFRRADRRAVTEVYRRHVDRVTRLVQRLLGSANDQDDVVQAVFMAAIKSAPNFRGDAHNLKGWLRQITVMQVRMFLRKRGSQRWLRFEDPSDLPQVATSFGSPEGRLAVQRVYAILKKLSVEERLVFALRFIDRQTVPAIATACDLSPSTVKRRLKRARQRFDALSRRDLILRDWITSFDGQEAS